MGIVGWLSFSICILDLQQESFHPQGRFYNNIWLCVLARGGEFILLNLSLQNGTYR